MKDLLFKGFFLMAPKWGWYILLAFLWGAFYESVFASNTDGVSETPTIIGFWLLIVCALYSVYVTLKSEK